MDMDLQARAPMAAALLLCAGIVGAVIWTPAGKGKRDDPFRIRFVHEGEQGCFPADGCRLEDHWKFFAGDRLFTGMAELDDLLPKGPGRSVLVSGPPFTTWGCVLSAWRACVNAGIPGVDWQMGDQSLQISRPPPPGTSPIDRLIVEEIRVVLKRNPADGTTERRIGPRSPIDSDDDLLAIIQRLVADDRTAGRTQFPILIDAAADVSWHEVVRVIERCRREGLTHVELDPRRALPPPPPDPPFRPPDKKLYQ